MLKVDVGSFVGVLAFLATIYLAIIVALFNDLGRGLRLDRHLIITRVLRLPEFIILTTLLCGLLLASILGETLDWVWTHRILWIFTAVATLIYLLFTILTVISAIGWLNSEDYSSRWRGSYKEQKRLKYLTGRDYFYTLAAWQEFWHDDKTYSYLGHGHFLPYIEAFLGYLAQIPPQYQAGAEELFRDFTVAMLRMQRQANVIPEPGLFCCLLQHFEQACLCKSKLLNRWSGLIRSYLDIMHLQDLAMLEDDLSRGQFVSQVNNIPSQRSFLRENPEFIVNPWRDAFEHGLTDDFCIYDPRAARKLAQIIWKYYHDSLKDPDDLKGFFQARREISPRAGRKLYAELIKTLSAPNSRSLAKFLTTQIEPVDNN